MKPRLSFLVLGLLVLTMLSACASGTPDPTVSVPTDTATAAQVAASPTVPKAMATSTVPPLPVQAVATSRGPELEATDPTTVSLASGQLQLVEFFRFT
jgi:hypothetical protein